MTDIFLSYARADHAIAELLADALRVRGWTVWMDSTLQPGEYWDEAIEAAIREARCLVVLWSRASIQSHWVRSEAEQARQRGILVPARIQAVEPPYGFARLHTADLSNWRPPESHPGLDELVSGVARLVASKPAPTEPVRADSPRTFRRALLLAVAIGLACLAGALMTMYPEEVSLALDVKGSGLTFAPEQAAEVSQLLVVSQIAATGFSRLEIPRTTVSPARTFEPRAGTPPILRLAPDETGRAGSITLAPLAVSSGSTVSLTAGEHAREFRWRADAARPLTIHVEGVLKALLPGQPPQAIDFGFPKPITLTPGASGLDVSFALANVVRLEPAPIRVRSLGFVRIEERMEGERLVTRELSTVVSGELRVDGRSGARPLVRGEEVLLEQPVGVIQELRPESDYIATRFEGAARGGRTCVNGVCADVRPTIIEWLWRRYPAPVMALGAAFLLAVTLLLRDLSGRPPGARLLRATRPE